MIGVVADPSEREVIREFFELFKTPWEWYREDRQYEVLLSAGDGPLDRTAKLTLIYASKEISSDGEGRFLAKFPAGQTCVLSYKGERIPIYGDLVTFPEEKSQFLVDEHSRKSVAYLEQVEQKVVVRIGYDLFVEVRHLLTQGQPPANADMPALEQHIAFLRDLIIEHGIRLIEVPPVPDGHSFIACLTHDVDHPSIRQHKWDHTVFGFLYRAVFGSLRRLISGRITLRDLFKNWGAALRLPFVYTGFASDFWREFDDRYLELEEGLSSTFFVIPFKNYSGKHPTGERPKFREARYGAADISDAIRKLTTAGCEVGLHGIDAWCDSAQGRLELEEIRRLTGESRIGVRMHWLYYDQQSPATLENEGAAYDSTIGYNETVGYRAGTTQAYKPFEVTRLLELPLHVMDTAMFYPTHLGLSPCQAKTVLSHMAGDVAKFGGCLTVNWHDRSLSPERLWDASYRDLLQDLRSRGAWFATAGEAVAWFRKRRAVVFETDGAGSEKECAKITSGPDDGLPGLRLRIHREQKSSGENSAKGSEDYFDLRFDESFDPRILSGVNR